MFKTNQEKFGVTSTYSDDLLQYTLVQWFPLCGCCLGSLIPSFPCIFFVHGHYPCVGFFGRRLKWRPVSAYLNGYYCQYHLHWTSIQVMVVQRENNAFQWIHHYSMDKLCYPLFVDWLNNCLNLSFLVPPSLRHLALTLCCLYRKDSNEPLNWFWSYRHTNLLVSSTQIYKHQTSS